IRPGPLALRADRDAPHLGGKPAHTAAAWRPTTERPSTGVPTACSREGVRSRWYAGYGPSPRTTSGLMEACAPVVALLECGAASRQRGTRGDGFRTPLDVA